MTALLDTHVLLWWLFDDRRLSKVVRSLIVDPSNRMLVSSASAWEIAIKHRLGKLKAAEVLVQDLSGWIARAAMTELPITVTHAQRAGSWPHAHRDPFDRMLAAQSAIEEVPLVTSDAVFRAFGVQTLW